MQSGSGRCLCGAVRYRFEGAPSAQNHCHCESCRRATASGFTSYLTVNRAALEWSGEPRSYASSPGVQRRFCGTCGTQLSYETVHRPGEIDLFAATLDNPGSFRPTRHDFWNEHVGWIAVGDGLPRHSAPRCMSPDEDFRPILLLVLEAFAEMDGRIDPPSSVHRLTDVALSQAAQGGEVWVIEVDEAPAATVTLEFSPNRVYLGKLAVAANRRRMGLARALVKVAAMRAKERGLPALELQTRVELTENHRAFEAMGFVRAGESAHPGFDRPTSVLYRLALPRT